MNVALILAGGTGQRMGTQIPKQFLIINDKPVIVYTLEKFQSNSEIDAIEVVCVESYIEEMQKYATKYGLSKIKWVVAGGDICQESIRNGVFYLESKLKDDDILMIHMSVSPLIDDEIILDSLSVCNQYGNAISVDPCIFNMCTINNGISSNKYILKEDYVTLNMPWTFKYSKILWAYKKAYSENIGTDVKSYTPTLMVDLGEILFFSKGSQKNKLKLTTIDDVDMFEGYLMLMEKRFAIK
jgi:2-C-methyl-D-erythritol 4-phosphate cytidylyltransferase